MFAHKFLVLLYKNHTEKREAEDILRFADTFARALDLHPHPQVFHGEELRKGKKEEIVNYCFLISFITYSYLF